MLSKSFNLMGTKINLSLERCHKNDGVLDYSYKMLKDFETRFSANNKNSELSKININAGITPIKVSDDLFELIKIGKKASLDSDMRLNIAIGALFKIWNIGFKNACVPSEDEIKKALDLINANDIVLDENTKEVYLKKKGMKLDLGAIAKGYFADKLRDYWLESGVKNGLIDLGRNIQSIGGSKANDFKFWSIGLQDPFRKGDNLISSVEIRNKSIVTSGTYEKYFEHKGNIYHHILSSLSGKPVKTNIVSISVISDSSLKAETYSTSLLSMNTEDALENIKKIDNTEVIIIDKSKNIFTSLK